jgi:hypothetical protein
MPIRMVPIIILVTIRWQTRGANTTSAAVQLDVTTVVRYHTIALNDSTNCSSARLMNILPFSRAFQGERHELEHIGWENPYMENPYMVAQKGSVSKMRNNDQVHSISSTGPRSEPGHSSHRLLHLNYPCADELLDLLHHSGVLEVRLRSPRVLLQIRQNLHGKLGITRSPSGPPTYVHFKSKGDVYPYLLHDRISQDVLDLRVLHGFVLHSKGDPLAIVFLASRISSGRNDWQVLYPSLPNKDF